MKKNTLWLRAETKPYERRTPLIPEHAAELVKSKHPIVVERSNKRIYKDKEYLEAGCKLVASGSWDRAPLNSYILGIKELPQATSPLKHTHIYFAHAYKNQEGAEQLLSRFKQGKGKLYDFEYMTDEKNKQVITYFSYWAGVAGCAITILIWLQKCRTNNAEIKIPEFYSHESAVIELIKQKLNNKNRPSSLIIGARGRCAKGVKDFLGKVGLEATLWYKKDTINRTSYSEIFQHNLLFNCIYITKPLVPFITKEQLATKKKLSIIADISCDPNGPCNPLPIYNKITTFKNPIRRVCAHPNSLDIMAIDHLPSFLPRDSSNDFSGQLLPYLYQLLDNGPQASVWARAAAAFNEHSS